MNELHLHLSDEAFGGAYTGFRVECSTYPGLTSKDCFYTKQQLRTLQDTAKLYGITVTPEIDMPSHARVFTDYWPDLRNPKLTPSELDVTNTATIERMKKLLDEMIPIFDAPDFHIGTDEYRVGGNAAEKQTFYDAFHQFINTMNAYVHSKGKNCRVWDGWEHMPSKIKGGPDSGRRYVVGHVRCEGLCPRRPSHHQFQPGPKLYRPGRRLLWSEQRAGIYQSWEPNSFSPERIQPGPERVRKGHGRETPCLERSGARPAIRPDGNRKPDLPKPGRFLRENVGPKKAPGTMRNLNGAPLPFSLCPGSRSLTVSRR